MVSPVSGSATPCNMCTHYRGRHTPSKTRPSSFTKRSCPLGAPPYEQFDNRSRRGPPGGNLYPGTASRLVRREWFNPIGSAWSIPESSKHYRPTPGINIELRCFPHGCALPHSSLAVLDVDMPLKSELRHLRVSFVCAKPTTVETFVAYGCSTCYSIPYRYSWQGRACSLCTGTE